jgi:alpha/beta superfamily hydrolase
MHNVHAERMLIPGAAGAIDTLIEIPRGVLRGIALIAHPHPAGGGANTNKVAHTLAKAFLQLGYAVFRPNFRGVGKSEGTHDEGRGEVDDLMTVLEIAQQSFEDGINLPVALAGFSFGAYCQTIVAQRLQEEGTPAERLVLVGTAAGFVEHEPRENPAIDGGVKRDKAIPGAEGSPDLCREIPGREAGMTQGIRTYDTAAVPADTIVIHGSEDSTVPLANVLAWAEPQNLPVVVVPGADHFFHRRLDLIRNIVLRAWKHG